MTLDAVLAACFVAIDTVTTLAGASWWPAHPGTLAWVMLACQGLADASLAFRRRAPIVVIAILAGFTLAVSLLISPAGLLTPENAGNLWAPYGTVLAAYGPFYYRKNPRTAFAAVGTLTLIVARVWEPSATVITIGVLRTAVGPLLALYFTARHEVLQGLRDRADRAEREQHLLAEQARTDERARLAGEMHDVVTHRVSLIVLQARSGSRPVMRRRGGLRKSSGPPAARRLRSSGTWWASCAPSPMARRRSRYQDCLRWSQSHRPWARLPSSLRKAIQLLPLRSLQGPPTGSSARL
jgi:signal transduction histidine kinase